MKLSLRIPGIGSPQVNLALLVFAVLANYLAISTFKKPLITHEIAGREYHWDAQYRDEGGVTQTMMFADREECDDEDNNDNGINELCMVCNGSGRTFTRATAISLAALNLGVFFALLRFTGLDTRMRPDTAFGSGLINYEITSFSVAFVTDVFGTFMWGTQCMALIDNLERSGLKYPGYTSACAGAALMGLCAVVSMGLKNRPSLWRFRAPDKTKLPAINSYPSSGAILNAPTSSAPVSPYVTTQMTTIQIDTHSQETSSSPKRGPPPQRNKGAPPPRRGPPPGPGPRASSQFYTQTTG